MDIAPHALTDTHTQHTHPDGRSNPAGRAPPRCVWCGVHGDRFTKGRGAGRGTQKTFSLYHEERHTQTTSRERDVGTVATHSHQTERHTHTNRDSGTRQHIRERDTYNIQTETHGERDASAHRPHNTHSYGERDISKPYKYREIVVCVLRLTRRNGRRRGGDMESD